MEAGIGAHSNWNIVNLIDDPSWQYTRRQIKLCRGRGLLLLDSNSIISLDRKLVDFVIFLSEGDLHYFYDHL